MIDSLLKGTGNSRFLKSAVPAGTSWADALAMLQAGTFPIDFNGINTEGFQQVGTPLNKANLLKDATAAQIGLPPSTTPDGMFQALGNTGELHVWRKTVTTAQEIPAGYNLVPVDMKTTTFMYLGNSKSSSASPELYYGGSATVNPDGSVSISAVGKLRGQIGWTTTSDAVVMKLLPSTTDSSIAITNNSELQSLLRGKFVYFIENKSSWAAPSYLSSDKFYQIPSNATITFRSGYSAEGNPSVIISISSVNEVVGYPLTPAGTTTTYPVSTNPNAYQEGDDAKAATYVLGDVAQQFLGANSAVGSGVQMGTYYSNSVAVTDDGTVSLVGEQESVWTLNSSGSAASNIQATLRGKYFRCVGYSGVKAPSGIFYMPNDAVVAYDNTGAISGSETRFCYYADRVARVTGQAAIPAGTTIEYLGKLGDKARVQVVSYVGTGTYGSSNPCSITSDFKIKIALFVAAYHHGGANGVSFGNVVMAGDVLTTSYQPYMGSGNSSNYYAKKSSDGKTFSWYQTSSATNQFNYSGAKYWVLAIG